VGVCKKISIYLFDKKRNAKRKYACPQASPLAMTYYLLRGALYCLHFSITIFKFSMTDPPLAKGDIGGFPKLLNSPLPPFSKGGDANKYMLRVIAATEYL
jgi:hypothetical protein